MSFNEVVETKIIKECVKRFENEFNDSVYIDYLEAAKKVNLKNAVELKNIIRDFLYRWGRMGRVLGRRKYSNWEQQLIELITLNNKELEELRTKDLIYVTLDEYELVIKKYYESFKEIVGPIAAVKTLHLICPNFFPLWDNYIAEAVRKERAIKEGEKFSASDYHNFMKDVRKFADSHEQTLSELAVQYRKGKLKILDESLWWITHRPISLFFG